MEEQDRTKENEAPLQSLPPALDLLSPPKPITEMTDQELSDWSVIQREHLSSFPTLDAHLRQGGQRVTKEKKAPDTSLFE